MELSGIAIAVVLTATTITTCGTTPSSIAGDGYSRAAFGRGWTDYNKDGCDTREEILERDADMPIDADSDGCRDDSTVVDRYTGRTVEVSVTDIDHVVSLHEAWMFGANSWTPEQRLKFANDPDNLVATHRSINRSKGDDDAVEWKTSVLQYSIEVRCGYVQTYRDVKNRYRLVITIPQQEALLEICRVGS